MNIIPLLLLVALLVCGAFFLDYIKWRIE